MGASRYSPSAGRWLQQDMYYGALDDLGLSQDPLTANRYAFLGANPVNYVEFDGHSACGWNLWCHAKRPFIATKNAAEKEAERMVCLMWGTCAPTPTERALSAAGRIMAKEASEMSGYGNFVAMTRDIKKGNVSGAFKNGVIGTIKVALIAATVGEGESIGIGVRVAGATSRTLRAWNASPRMARFALSMGKGEKLENALGKGAPSVLRYFAKAIGGFSEYRPEIEAFTKSMAGKSRSALLKYLKIMKKVGKK